MPEEPYEVLPEEPYEVLPKEPYEAYCEEPLLRICLNRDNLRLSPLVGLMRDLISKESFISSSRLIGLNPFTVSRRH